MFLKKGINYVDFIHAVQKCKADVYYVSTEGDRLNLHSSLCKYLFISAATQENLLAGGMIECRDSSDYALLQEFLEEAL